MPDFGNPYAGNFQDRKMTKDEIVLALRFAISSEFEATQLYTQIANSTDDTVVKNVMLDIADEERVHAGEFLRLLNYVDAKEAELLAKGAREVEGKFINPNGEGKE